MTTIEGRSRSCAFSLSPYLGSHKELPLPQRLTPTCGCASVWAEKRRPIRSGIWRTHEEQSCNRSRIWRTTRCR